MKKLILLGLVCIATLSANAQLLLNETFNYTTPKLAGVANDPNTSATNNTTFVWYQTGKTTDSNSASFPFSDHLYYIGYVTSGLGKSVLIDWGGAGTNNRVDVCRFVPMTSKFNPSNATTGTPYSGNLYYSFLLQVNNAANYSGTADGTDWRDIFMITEGGSDVLGNSYRGRFFIRQDTSDPSIIHYTITKNASITLAAGPTNEGTFPAGTTVLIVIRQNFNVTAATTNNATNQTGTVDMIVNPTISSTEPATGWLNGTPGDVNTFGGTYGVAIRRRALGSTANILLGGLRVAQKWSDIMGFSTGVSQVEKNSSNITANGKTIVTTESGSLKVYNLAGKEVLSSKTEGKLNTSLSKGLYLVRFVGIDGTVKSAKVEIN